MSTQTSEAGRSAGPARAKERTMSDQFHAVRFPGETDEYRRARNELLEAEIELRKHSESVAVQRRHLPLGGEVPTDYSFEESPDDAHGTRTVRLAELFE